MHHRAAMPLAEYLALGALVAVLSLPTSTGVAAEEPPPDPCHDLFECTRTAVGDLLRGPALDDLRAAVVASVLARAAGAAQVDGPRSVPCEREETFTVSTGLTMTYEAPQELAARILDAVRGACTADVRLQSAQVHARPGDMRVAVDIAPGERARLVGESPMVVERASQKALVRIQGEQSGKVDLEASLVRVDVLGIGVTVNVGRQNCGTTVGLPIADGFARDVAQSLGKASIEVICPGK